MIYPNFCGQSYVDVSPAVDGEVCRNLFPEIINLPGVKPKSKIILRRKPGHNLLQALPDFPGRGKFSINGRDFAVNGGSFFELLSPTTSILRGSFAYGVTPVQMECNTVEICILADGLGYIYNLASGAFAQITAAGFPANAVSLTSIDTYFIVLGANSNEFALSEPLQGLLWKGINFGSSQEPDNAVAVKQLHLYLWIFGQKETVIFQDTGNASFPFQRVPGSQIEQGLAALETLRLLDNTLFWLGMDERGAAVFYRADGFLPTRVSTHAVEAAIQSYARFDDAISFPYQQNGQLFYVTHFPTAKKTWAYGVASGMWHDRGFWNVQTAQFETEIGRFHSYCFGKHLVSDYRNGNIYELSTAFAQDNGAAIRWIRAAPHISNEENWLCYSYFQVDMGVGGGGLAGAECFCMVRWSNDGGFTWSTPRQASMGAIGEYLRRVKVNRCGRSRNRVFEISGTDPVPNLVINGAYLGVDEGVN
jgi:hypothetical protein